jgi:hypothetical protein
MLQSAVYVMMLTLLLLLLAMLSSIWGKENARPNVVLAACSVMRVDA